MLHSVSVDNACVDAHQYQDILEAFSACRRSVHHDVCLDMLERLGQLVRIAARLFEYLRLGHSSLETAVTRDNTRSIKLGIGESALT